MNPANLLKIFVPAILAVTVAAAIEWQPDYETAARVAKERGSDLFIFVNGSDWSSAGRTYKRSVLQNPAVERSLANFVCLEIDRPDKPSEQQKEVAKLNRKFEVTLHNYPAVVLLDKDERCILKAENPPAEIPALARLLREALNRKTRRDTALAQAAKMEKLHRAAALGKVLEALDSYALRDRRHSHRYLLSEIRKLDPEDTTGVHRRLEFNFDSFGERQIWPLLREKKYDEAMQLVEKELKDPRNDTKLRQHFMAYRFHVYQSQDKLDEAVRTLQQMIQLAPTTDMAQMGRNYIEYLTKPIPLESPEWKPEHLRPYFASWRLDASKLITTKGSYTISFHRTGGEDLSIRDVTLMAGNRELATGKPEGKHKSVTLEVGNLPAGQRLWLNIAAKGHGWFSSRGEIKVANNR